MTDFVKGQQAWICSDIWDTSINWKFGTQVTIEDTDDTGLFINIRNSRGVTGSIYCAHLTLENPNPPSPVDIALEYFNIIADYTGHPANMKSIAKEAIKALTK